MAVQPEREAVARDRSPKSLIMKDRLLLIFIRNPEMGKVKTRLARSIGKERALEVYLELLRHTREVSLKINCDRQLYYSEYIDHHDQWPEEQFKKKLQKGEDLGERMKRAFEEAFSEGYKQIIIIGSDLIDLCVKDLESAFSKLDRHELVIGPAADGGYYLIGMKKNHDELFEDKPWGTSEVLKKTLESLAKEDVALLRELNDIDTLDDLENSPAGAALLN
ncbi:TIGR04282 family arsenosugar biosynthesis glycosyltransferase [Robertkochia aurantiaca]|uniref:TIGR04282 family arsenosugar biosynthesis glycosyltransferase n=1 Tax=Robertkochia aurantiaca TaxID=2873700 RepID=UPI001CCCEA27|nr:TIGR04282 family arsenosugar biosynthesis glycosyltransferase [Robertkochia sp. 3YJGBD-33]